MYNVYLKVYYRPNTDIVVAFIPGYTNKKFKVKKMIKGLRVDNQFVPASAEVVFENNFKGLITAGSEECRFCKGNSDNFSRMYLLYSLPEEFQAIRQVQSLTERLKVSALLFR